MRPRSRADCSRRTAASSCLRLRASSRLALSASRSGSSLLALGRDRRGDLARLLAGQLDEVVVLEQVADDGGGGGLAGDGRGQHHPGDRQAVALDDAGQHLAQLLARRVVGVVAELLDAVGQRRVGEHEGDALHRPVDAGPSTPPRGSPPASPRRPTTRSSASRWSSSRASTAAASSSSDAARIDAVEQPERLQPRLHLIHGRATLSLDRRQRPATGCHTRYHPAHGHRGSR